MQPREAKINMLGEGGIFYSSIRYLPALLLIMAVVAATCGSAMAANSAVGYVTGSTQKICQVTGDYDSDINFQNSTINRTYANYDILGVDLGVSFRHNNKTYFLFGDTENDGANDCLDSVAYTTDTNPSDGLSLTFVSSGGTFIPPTVTGESLGCMGVPTEGISYNGSMYVYFTKNGMVGSYLGKCTNESSLTFSKLYDLSSSKFINVQAESVDTASTTAYNSIRQYIPTADQGKTILFIWGSGSYRASDPYLAYMVFSNIETKSQLHYFTGMNGATPTWSTYEFQAVSLFSQACIGEFSVTWNPYLNKWLMLFNCGTPRGINYRVADYPWGPWSETKLLFDPGPDNGYGYFMHQGDCHTPPSNSNCSCYYDEYGSYCCDCGGPTPCCYAGYRDDNKDNLQSDGCSQVGCRWGGEYGPYVISDFTTGVAGQNTTIYFTLSTWNPYQVMLLKSTLQMVPPIVVTSPASGEDLTINATKTVRWTATGIAGNVKIELGRPSGCGYAWSSITNSTPAGNESFSFTVPGPSQQNCIIRVTSLNNTTIYGDSGSFDIVSTTTTSVRPTTTTTSIRPTTSTTSSTTTTIRTTSSTTSSTTTTSCVAPGKTSLNSVSLNGGKTPTFSWTAVSNVSGYYVDVCNTVNTDCITNGGAFTGKDAGTNTSLNWGATFGPGTWYYRVNAYRDCGGTRYWTSSNVGSFTETNNAPTLGSVGVAQYASCGTHNQTYSMSNNVTFDNSWYIQWLGSDDYGVNKGFYSMKLHSSSTWPSNTYFTRNDSVSRCMNYYGINTDNWAWLWPVQAASSGGLYDIKLGIQDVYGTETSITYTNITLVK